MSSSKSDNSEKRKFTVHFDDGTEDHLFEVSEPYFAALKAARREIDPDGFTDPETAEQENASRIYLREIPGPTLHVYKAWTWKHRHACPECGSQRVYSRKEKTPTYRCAACGHEMDEPADLSDVDEVSESDPDWLFEDNEGELTGAEATNLGKSRVPDGEQYDKSR